jgi:type I restriction-modification system DNA methylase subunit
MNIAQIEVNLQALIKSYTKESFIYDLLLAYNTPKASISRLQKGNLNQSKIADEISWKKKLFFKAVEGEDLTNLLERIKNYDKAIKPDPRFIIVTDYKQLIALDRKTQDKIDIKIEELPKHFDFFLPWAGMEKATHQNENPADVKAAEKMAKLFVEIKKDNPDTSPEFIHGLNVFLSRLLFCFFAEDTNIFNLGQFTNAIASHTQVDGSDLNHYLDTLFEVLNTPENKRKDLAEYLSAFPYVNGGLFKHKQPTPVFTRRSRQAIVDAGEMNWSDINPDIFGSMFQAVISVDQRGSLGQHYTSVPNIMKVIEPLFLNDLYEEFDNAIGNQKKLTDLLLRLQNIKIFDPACGSGNFLIIAYKELRKLEIDILNELQQLKGTSGLGSLDFGAEFMSHISLNNFYGIEIDDFAHEIAKLALWLAEHQMNMEFFKTFGKTNPTLPLKDAGLITHGNATRVDWEIACPKKEGDEIYILGNPPYLGARNQSEEQKNDMKIVFNNDIAYKDCDYICSWFIKGSEYISGTNSKFSFVSTNSITQGEQVSYLWPRIFNLNLEIGFAFTSFKWINNAKSNAGVSVVIIGVRNVYNKEKYIYVDNVRNTSVNITPYLTPGNNSIVCRRSKPLSNQLPNMSIGSMARDGGNLILSLVEKNNLLDKSQDLNKIIKPLFGSQEFIQGDERWCLWIEDDKLEFASSFQSIKDRINKVFEFRKTSKAKTTNGYAAIPHKFAQRCYQETNAIIIPSTSSERREYIPIGFLNIGTVVTNSANVIYNSDPFIFGILHSKIHNLWVRAIGGQLETRIRYSPEICYNTFPLEIVSKSVKDNVIQSVFKILEIRETYSEKTIAQLYDPDKMPEGLREAHRLNDLAVERCYRSKPFESDEERLEYLFKLYEKMIAEEKEKDTLFQSEKKMKKTKTIK